MITAFLVRLTGIVQGVGFRPTVKRLADETGVKGHVRNAGAFVEIFVQGTKEQTDAFLSALKSRAPGRSEILGLTVTPARPVQTDSFRIAESQTAPGEIFISPDIAVCDDCARELFDKDNIRYLHPFINCTLCGPRFTILKELPYDRERTAMRDFPMCPSCAAQYRDPASRRFDAQPVCCPHCGPVVTGFAPGKEERLNGADAIRRAREVIRGGGIVAIKGIGGFHLCCDAFRDTALQRLRERKHRPAKPFALMMRDMEAVRRFCVVSTAEEAALTGHRKPIVLLEKRGEGAAFEAERVSLSPAVAPDNPYLGVMLPYAPIHLLLFSFPEDPGAPAGAFPEALVMTSGNVSGAPIAKDDEGAVSMLGGIADYFLSHNRPILTRADDSVVVFSGEKLHFLRRSRGYAPLPVFPGKTESKGDILAVGGELVNTFCIGKGGLLYPSAYIGDMEDFRSLSALEEGVARMGSLLKAELKTVVCDLHPLYHTAAFAERFAERTGARLLKVQHHYAHILSCMAEHGLSGRVLGIAFDGTGYGTDGTIWGGEILEADRKGFERRASLAPFAQPGGDAGAREGWRMALSLINRAFPGEESRRVISALGLCDEESFHILGKMLSSGTNTLRSSSAGRLFDAVSAILGFRRESTFEGEAAMALQFAAERQKKSLPEGEALSDLFPGDEAGVSPVIETDPLIRRMVEGRLTGEAPEALAFEFHQTLAALTARKAWELGQKTGLSDVVLSGGCFQNLLFLRLLSSRLSVMGFRVFAPEQLPANDGGLSAGQCLYGFNH